MGVCASKLCAQLHAAVLLCCAVLHNLLLCVACVACVLLQAASDVYSPVSGEVVEINSALVDEPATVRLLCCSCVQKCWMARQKQHQPISSLTSPVGFTVAAAGLTQCSWSHSQLVAA